ncbi:DUF6678 family protein [Bacillus ndiopicus]|uniref:DUF6678 family protein n=1 Tax=Bacillus ndiopicus TaxID=1347368 RepID=UPI0005A795A1|nr:DUF6678 family protein [Bacillus ndiopicus]
MNQKITKLLAEKGLASYMNDTKWRKLSEGIENLPFSPAYQVKTLFEDEPYPAVIEIATDWLGDWGRTPEAALGVHIEWIKVAPKFKRYMGRLVTPIFEDCSDELRALLEAISIPFVEKDGFFVIYGHAREVDF